MINTTVKLSPQGQITIPREIRLLLGMDAGSEIILSSQSQEPKTLTLTPKPASWVDRVAGTGKGMWGKNVDQYVENIRNDW